MRSQAGAGGPPSAREADAECRGSGRPLQTPQKKTKALGSFSTVSRLWNLLTPDLALSVVIVSSLNHVQLLRPHGL